MAELNDVIATSYFKVINGVTIEFPRLTLGDIGGLLERYGELSKAILKETLDEEKADKETRLRTLYQHKLNAKLLSNLSVYASTTAGMLDILLTSTNKKAKLTEADIRSWPQSIVGEMVLRLLEVKDESFFSPEQGSSSKPE